MPLYDYSCPACRTRRDIFKPLAELDRAELCHKCEGQMERQISAPLVIGDYAGYSCPITGTWIEGRKAHRENLAKHECRVYEPGERQAFERRKAKEEAAFDASIDQTVEQFVEALPTASREALFAGVEGGLDLQTERL